MGNVDWTRMAKPQADQYDTKVLLSLHEPGHELRDATPEEGSPTCFNGRVLLRSPRNSYSDELVAAPLDHPSIKKAEDLLQTVWPEMFEQIATILDVFEPILDKRFPDNDTMSGCCCGGTSSFGGVYSTVNGSLGLAEGIVHEVGHMKLHAMGVHLMDWSRLVGNSPEARYASPIRKDITRPMGAVLQAQYSYIHVLEFNVRAHQAGVKCGMFRDHFRRMKDGRLTLQEHYQGTVPEGVAFMAGLDAWTVDLFARAELCG
jgi:HEXXH motif-containing protein